MKENPKETEPEKAAKRLHRYPSKRNLQRYLKAMRDFRFRAWDKEEQCWLDPKHFYITGSGEPYTCQQGRHNISCRYELMGTERYIIERFTGLKDWYAGDIIQKGEIIRAITIDWEHGLRFMLGKHILCKQDAVNGTKIGNIHQNPKLLEQDNDSTHSR